MKYNSTSSDIPNLISSQSSPPQSCYCEPSFFQAPSECNPAGCKTVSALILTGFIVCLCFCLFRFYQLWGRKDSKWPFFTLSLLILVCLIRIVRAILTLFEENSFILMGFLFVIPLGLLICCFFSTLFVWVKIIYHINFSRLVTKIFPFLGKVMLASQGILMTLLIIVVFANLKYDATNIVLCVFLGYGVICAVIFTKMIWDEYKDISGRDCGVFSEGNHQKIKKIFKLSITAIFVTLLTLGLTIWSFNVKGVLTIPHAIAFNFIGRFIEISWVSVMLIILAPQLQTWSQNSARTPSAMRESTDFDDDSESLSSGGGGADIENNLKDINNNNTPTITKETDNNTTTATVTTSPITNSPVNNI